jgi:hypothetical protein
MAWKVSDLIEHLEKNFKATDTIFTFIYNKEDVREGFSYEPTDDEWESIADSMGGDYSSDALYEEFRDAVNEVLGDKTCDDCSEISNEIITNEDEGEKYCQSCLDKEKERKAEAEKAELLAKTKVPDENIIY